MQTGGSDTKAGNLVESSFVWEPPETLFACVNQLSNTPLFPGYYCRFVDATGDRIELRSLLLDPIEQQGEAYRGKTIVIQEDGTLAASVEQADAEPVRHPFRETPLSPVAAPTYIALQFFRWEEEGPIVKIPLEMGRLILDQKRWQTTTGATLVAQVERKIGAGYLVRLVFDLAFLPNSVVKQFSSEELIGKEFNCEVIHSVLIGESRDLCVVVKPISSFRESTER